MSDHPALNERAQHLLKILIERFIEEGKPVGSRALSREVGLDLSPATIRNVMADLEDMGMVSSPHTSAGRVPTVSGYRLFVDSLLSVKSLRISEVQRLKQELDLSDDPQELLEKASSIISGITRMTGVVTLPKPERVSFRQVEFLQLSHGRVLAILVTNEQEVHNRIIHPTRDYSAAELVQASNFLNEAFAGEDLDDVRQRLLREMQDAREDMNKMMLAAIEIGQKMLTDEVGEDYVLAGQTNLMEFSELGDMGRLRDLFDAFQQKQEILSLLEQCLHAEGVQIYIGEESGYKVLDECSVVTAPYLVDDRVVGVLGVIGPTRMNYRMVIPLVDVTAKLLGSALQQR